jgi:hypothetical protein
MKRITVALFILLLALSGCGGEGEQKSQTAKPPEVTQTPEATVGPTNEGNTDAGLPSAEVAKAWPEKWCKASQG